MISFWVKKMKKMIANDNDTESRLVLRTTRSFSSIHVMYRHLLSDYTRTKGKGALAIDICSLFCPHDIIRFMTLFQHSSHKRVSTLGSMDTPPPVQLLLQLNYPEFFFCFSSPSPKSDNHQWEAYRTARK